jgi:hypothetical protein
LRIDKIESDAALAYTIGLATILAIWECFITLQMPLSASQTPCAYSLWFVDGLNAISNRGIASSITAWHACSLSIAACAFAWLFNPLSLLELLNWPWA